MYLFSIQRLPQINPILANPARSVQNVDAGGVAPDMESDVPTGHCDPVAGHGVGISTVSDVADRDVLIAAHRQPDDRVACLLYTSRCV